MEQTNPVTEEVKKVAEETGAQAETVAEGRLSNKEMDSVERSLDCGARMILTVLAKEGINLTDEQKEEIKKAYGASFAITTLLMK